MTRRFAALLLAPSLALAYSEGPPPAHTGGFGEPDCGSCHFGPDDGIGAAGLELRGFPARYEPGEDYPVRIRLFAGGMAAAGVALAARLDDGGQAGQWHPGPGLELAEQNGVAYLRHASAIREGPAAWEATWTAPALCAGRVRVHAAANAANGDDSALGDRIETASLAIEPAPACDGQAGGRPPPSVSSVSRSRSRNSARQAASMGQAAKNSRSSNPR